MFAGFGILTWCVVQLRRGQAFQSAQIDKIIKDKTNEHNSMLAYVQQYGSHFNHRLIQLETENKTFTPKKRDDDDDPLGGPRSWASVASAIERAEGVRL